MDGDAVIIGGGPAGLMATAVAAQRGRNVLLIDKSRLLAKKLRITGRKVQLQTQPIYPTLF